MTWEKGKSRTSYSTQHRALRRRVLARDRHQCKLGYTVCVGKATICDHIVSLADGGADTDANCQAACEPCHKQKTQRESAAALRAQFAQLKHPAERHPGLI